MQPHSHPDQPHHDPRQPPPLTSPSPANSQQIPLLPPPDSLVAGIPSYAPPRHVSLYDQRYHGGGHAITHALRPPTSSSYGAQQSSHASDQFRQSHLAHPPPNHHSSDFSAQHAPHAQQRFSQGPPTQSHATTPQHATHRSNASWMPNLLASNRESSINALNFNLVVRQQPRAARACGFGDRDRRVIDPPPIVQLRIDGAGLSEEEKRAYLRFPHYVMNCSIWDESGSRDASYMPDEYQHQRRLMGSLIGTPFVGKDDKGDEGCFFCFSDLSCRTPGTFRLRFTLFMIDPARAAAVRNFPLLAEMTTEIFHVYSAKEFPGMVASSELAKRLKEQGCIISIKKGNERARGRGRDEDEDE